MDIFTTLVRTCKKLYVSTYAYLRDCLTHRRSMPRSPSESSRLRGYSFTTSRSTLRLYAAYTVRSRSTMAGRVCNSTISR